MFARSQAGRRVIAAVAVSAGLLATAAPAAAQITVHRNQPQMINPWGNGSVFGFPTYQSQQFLGTLPNGTPLVDPWSRPTVIPPTLAIQSVFAYQYAMLSAASIWNPSLAPYWANAGLGYNSGFGANQFLQPGAFGPGIQAVQPTNVGGVQPGLNLAALNLQSRLAFGPVVQQEPGRFARVGPDLAVNRITGTVLQPYSGVAYTNEGTFYRLPGTGSFTPFGAYIPGTGQFINPFTGVAYNPQTGMILR